MIWHCMPFPRCRATKIQLEVSGRTPKIPSRERESSQLVDAAISCLDHRALENGSQLYRVGYQTGNGEGRGSECV